MSLRHNALLLVLLTAAIAIAGDWSADPVLAGLWRLPAALLLAGLTYESWIVARSALSYDIEPPERFFLGRRGVVRYTFRHALRRDLQVEVAPSAPDSFELDDAVSRLTVAAAAIGWTERHVTATQLGTFAWPPLSARIGGSLRLAWWPTRLSCQSQVRVVPDLFRSAVEVAGLGALGEKFGRQIGAGMDVVRLRDYRPGDSPRGIDWKATARAGRLISRDLAQEYGLQVVIVVDAGRASAMRAGPLDRFGNYVNVAARLAQYAATRDDLVGLVIYADRPLAALAPVRGAEGVARLRAVLSAARVAPTESNPVFAAMRVASLARHRSLIVVLTDVDDATAAGQLVQAMRLLLSKHLPFVAGLSSPEVDAMSLSPARHWLDPYRSLAAQEYRTGLERKVQALNALGVPALAARPERLEHAVFAAYEDFRRRRRA
jgi:uncharacterized protein (DUF58 family)